MDGLELFEVKVTCLSKPVITDELSPRIVLGTLDRMHEVLCGDNTTWKPHKAVLIETWFPHKKYIWRWNWLLLGWKVFLKWLQRTRKRLSRFLPAWVASNHQHNLQWEPRVINFDMPESVDLWREQACPGDFGRESIYEAFHHQNLLLSPHAYESSSEFALKGEALLPLKPIIIPNLPSIPNARLEIDLVRIIDASANTSMILATFSLNFSWLSLKNAISTTTIGTSSLVNGERRNSR
ncbi:hypothetical protein SELMODRAFT_403536 [Selaginella moellendorffii]|uniref:Uncharacterized protein n=1 Tax=Selaginella moellendorffii TaxID=88036 RepID=D8QRQ8_SELML|nr:hypothetical protein SELMODRAFT_403536 [Selaginella moellendorffii]